MKKTQCLAACITLLLVLGSIGFAGAGPGPVKVLKKTTPQIAPLIKAVLAPFFWSKLDIAPPAVSSVSPAGGAKQVPVTAKITITFSEAMNRATAQTAFSMPSTPGAFSWSADSRTMTYVPSATLKTGAAYSFAISTAATDAAGNHLASGRSWSFITKPAASPDVLAAGTWAGRALMWDAMGGTLLFNLSHPGNTHSVAWSPDGTRIASGANDNAVKIWNANSGALIKTLAGHTGTVLSVSWSPDGTKVASGADSPDNTVKIWNASTGAVIRTLTNANDSYEYSVAWSPDGTKIAAGDGGHHIKIWNAVAGTIIRTFTDSSYVLSVAWSPDGTKIASGSGDGSVKIWDASAGTVIRTLTAHSNAARSVSWSPDGTKVASGGYSDNTVKISDTASGTLLITLTDTAPVFSVAWNRGGSKIASGSDNGIRVWDTATMALNTTLGGGCAFSVAWKP